MFTHTSTEDYATILTYRAKITTQLKKKRLEQQEMAHLLPVAQVF